MIIGLTGKAGAGKDTVANILANYNFVRVSFADPVREAVLALDPIVEYEDSYGDLFERRASWFVKIEGWDEAKRKHDEIRRLLQVVGTEVGRGILGENVWVDLANKKIEALNDKNPTDIVITDVRFPNEVEFVRNHPLWGVIVKIERPNNPNQIAATHASERLKVEPDYILTNNHTIESLAQSVKYLLESIAGDMGG